MERIRNWSLANPERFWEDHSVLQKMIFLFSHRYDFLMIWDFASITWKRLKPRKHILRLKRSFPFDMLGYCTSKYSTCRLKWVIFEMSQGFVTQTTLVDSFAWIEEDVDFNMNYHQSIQFQCRQCDHRLLLPIISDLMFTDFGKTKKDAGCTNQTYQTWVCFKMTGPKVHL